MKTLECDSFITTEPKGLLSLSSHSNAIPAPDPKLFATEDQAGTGVRLEVLVSVTWSSWDALARSSLGI